MGIPTGSNFLDCFCCCAYSIVFSNLRDAIKCEWQVEHSSWWAASVLGTASLQVIKTLPVSNKYELYLSKNTSPQSSCTCLNIFKWTICNQNSSVSRHHYSSDSFCPISNVPTLSSAQTQCLALGTALQGGCCTLTRLERKTRGGMKIGKIWKRLIQIEWGINMVVRKARRSCKQLINELARNK